jgi:hypothetical protein
MTPATGDKSTWTRKIPLSTAADSLFKRHLGRPLNCCVNAQAEPQEAPEGVSMSSH